MLNANATTVGVYSGSVARPGRLWVRRYGRRQRVSGEAVPTTKRTGSAARWAGTPGELVAAINVAEVAVAHGSHGVAATSIVVVLDDREVEGGPDVWTRSSP
jgi:hypothetical protein